MFFTCFQTLLKVQDIISSLTNTVWCFLAWQDFKSLNSSIVQRKKHQIRKKLWEPCMYFSKKQYWFPSWFWIGKPHRSSGHFVLLPPFDNMTWWPMKAKLLKKISIYKGTMSAELLNLSQCSFFSPSKFLISRNRFRIVLDGLTVSFKAVLRLRNEFKVKNQIENYCCFV